VDRHGKLDAGQLAPAPRGEHLDQRLAHHLCVRGGCSDDESPGWHDEVGRPRVMDWSGVVIDPNAETVTGYCSAVSVIKQMPCLECSGCRVSHIMSRHPTAAS
jgi:hypothetical protein